MSFYKKMLKVFSRISGGWYRPMISPAFIMQDIKNKSDDELIILFSELRVCNSKNSTPYELVFNYTIREIKKRKLITNKGHYWKINENKC